ncbi:glycoside/pentoside/hexuronide:cation symporter, GPH family [Raineyella antarctica]|uniref:Glycoside/pentoside/hexuronide:cation symporter, GPH family n=1 Tax=Raineyella antarctica TaxID=1577474 RepID=A0A1G6GFK7_9ACTN|nr:glycoside-pentoside-hexuronide (GPH):cation symporter [Raineyella antarctica]SDB80767.1 glycoside/pentoside/hexuronide:cation symporter, GPH family [Raineyella antarctica]
MTTIATGTVASPAKTVRPFSIRDKLGYMFGDFGNDFSFILQMMFFMLFYTNIMGIKPAHVGTLFLVVRLVDAFVDVAVGRLVDLSKPRKDGKFRPWIKIFAIPVALSSALMYMSFISDWSYTGRLLWMTISYVLWGSMFYSLINIPYGSMASVISNKPEHRAALSVFRSTGATLAVLVIQVVLPLVVYVDRVEPNGAVKAVLSGSRMTWAAIACAVLSVVFYLLCYVNVAERVQPPVKAASERQSFGKMLGSLAKNRAMIGIVIAALLLLVANLLTSAMTGYLWLDYFNSKNLQSVAGFAGLAPTLLLLGIAPWLSTKFGKKEVGVAVTLLCGVTNIVMYFLNLQHNPTAFIVLFAVAQFALATFNYLIWAFITDVIDYQEVRTTERDDGTVYAIYSWARKLGQAIAGGLGGWALGWIGYQSVAKGQPPVEQAQSTLHGIYMLSTLVPGIVYIGVALALAFIYPLGKKAVAHNVAELEKRHVLAAAAAV